MADVLKDREKGFEAKYKHDEELHFKAHARRNRLLGLWAAERLGLEGDAARDYATELVKLDFDRAGDDNVAERIVADLAAKDVFVTLAEIHANMDRFYATALIQVSEEYPAALDKDHTPIGG